MNKTVSMLLVAALAACGQSQPEKNENFSLLVPKGTTKPPPPPAPHPPPPAFDPKSPQAAGQVVQHYGALIEQRRFPEAEQLWNDEGSAKDFTSDLMRAPEVHVEIGKPGDMEGAAGSSYVTVPAVFYGKDTAGAPFRRPADIILRRVNDVPGSTEEQRRWHIERIDWKHAS